MTFPQERISGAGPARTAVRIRKEARGGMPPFRAPRAPGQRPRVEEARAATGPAVGLSGYGKRVYSHRDVWNGVVEDTLGENFFAAAHQ